MKVLLALDATPAGHAIVEAAAARLWPSGSTLCLATAIDTFFLGKNPSLLVRAKQKAFEYLESEVSSLAGLGYKIETQVVHGSPRRAINHLALEWEADLVMVGSRGLDATERVFLGSTAQSVLRHAPCSVEIVRSLGGQGQPSSKTGVRLLVATDGSECSLMAVKCVASRPWPNATRVQIVSVPQLVFEFNQFPYVEAHELESVNKAAVQASYAAVAEAAALLSHAGLEVSMEVPLFHEMPDKVILMVAEKWHPDLIVVGSHGRSGFERLVMGSVSEAVALHAKGSVEVIRERRGQVQRKPNGAELEQSAAA